MMLLMPPNSQYTTHPSQVMVDLYRTAPRPWNDLTHILSGTDACKWWYFQLSLHWVPRLHFIIIDHFWCSLRAILLNQYFLLFPDFFFKHI